MLCIEFDELSDGGVAGAVAVESDGAFGEVDCCLEHATRASALRHNKRRLRFMEITSLYVGGQNRPGSFAMPGGNDRSASQVVFHPFFTVSSRDGSTMGRCYAPPWCGLGSRTVCRRSAGVLINDTRSDYRLGQMPPTGRPLEPGLDRSDGDQ